MKKIRWTGETPICMRSMSPRISLDIKNNEPFEVTDEQADQLLRDPRVELVPEKTERAKK
jgi:hypothetical protein